MIFPKILTFCSKYFQRLETMFTVVALSKIYPACQSDENEIKPGSTLNNADRRVAEPLRAEFLGIK